MKQINTIKQTHSQQFTEERENIFIMYNVHRRKMQRAKKIVTSVNKKVYTQQKNKQIYRKKETIDRNI